MTTNNKGPAPKPEYVLRYAEPGSSMIEHRSPKWGNIHPILRKLILRGKQVVVKVER